MTARRYKQLFDAWMGNTDGTVEQPDPPQLLATHSPLVLWVGSDGNLWANNGSAGGIIQIDPTATIRWLRATFPDEFAAVAGEGQG